MVLALARTFKAIGSMWSPCISVRRIIWGSGWPANLSTQTGSTYITESFQFSTKLACSIGTISGIVACLLFMTKKYINANTTAAAKTKVGFFIILAFIYVINFICLF